MQTHAASPCIGAPAPTTAWSCPEYAGQLTQCAWLVAAGGSLPKVLCSSVLPSIVVPQKMHSSKPAESLNEPTTHGSQPVTGSGGAPAPKWPTRHVQSSTLLEAIARVVFACGVRVSSSQRPHAVSL